MLFQATSEQMLEAYSHVPRPFGTIVANEVFSSGVIMSEYAPPLLHAPFLDTDIHDYSTDFRQFEEYLDVTGLDVGFLSYRSTRMPN